jgi:hypothetical protein
MTSNVKMRRVSDCPSRYFLGPRMEASLTLSALFGCFGMDATTLIYSRVK